MHFSFKVLDVAEKESDGLVFFRHTKLKEVAALLQQFNLLEDLTEGFEDLESVGLGEDELHEGRQAHLAIIDLSLQLKV